MGSYDTLVDFDLKCPYCGCSSYIDVQTKDLSSTLTTYYVHKKAPKKCLCRLKIVQVDHTSVKHLRKIKAIADCKSPLCLSVSRMKQLYQYNYMSGFGRIFNLEYNVDIKGRVVAPAKIIIPQKEKENINDVTLKFKTYLKTHPRIKKKFDKILKKCYNDMGIAINMFYY